MYQKTFHLEIVTPERTVFAGDAYSLIVPAAEGYLGIMPGHAPLLCTLDSGEISLKSPDGELFLAIGAGFMEVTPNRVTILAESIERPEEIDVERAQRAKERAIKRLRLWSPDIDYERAEAALRRSLNRLKIAAKRKKGHKS